MKSEDDIFIGVLRRLMKLSNIFTTVLSELVAKKPFFNGELYVTGFLELSGTVDEPQFTVHNVGRHTALKV